MLGLLAVKISQNQITKNCIGGNENELDKFIF